MLYAGSSFVHLVTFAIYFLVLSQPIHIAAYTDSRGFHPASITYNAPFGYYNPTFWDGFYIFYTFVAAFLFYHGLRTLYKGYRALPEYIEEIDNKGYETERIDRT